MKTSSFSYLLQHFFSVRLVGQLDASSHTVGSYRDSFRLLLRFAADHFGRTPSELSMEELDVFFIEKFLEHLELKRGNSARTRNNRLSALRAFFRYVSINEPTLALHCQRILAIPAKRYDRGPVEFLSQEEISALLDAPDLNTWIGRRDRMLLLIAVQTGLRNSEITALRCQDVELGTGAHVRCFGKGRKMRCTPLRSDVASLLEEWLSERSGSANEPLFPSLRGTHLSADALQKLVARHAATARECCPSLSGKVVTPHTLWHSTAMDLLRRGVDLSVIALWLGHESTETTQIYIHADMQLKERALAHSTESGLPPERYIPSDPLLTFLESL